MTSTTDTTQHPDVSEISDLTEGLLSPSRTADVRRHLDGCPLCADVRTSLEEIRGLLGTLPGPVRMPAEIAGRIDAALAAEALLDATAPESSVDVSRETSTETPEPRPAPSIPAAPRPAGHPRAATGPGRPHGARRRRVAALSAVLGMAAVGVSVLLLQTTQGPGGSAGDTKTSVSAPDSLTFAGEKLSSRVDELLAADEAPATKESDRGSPFSAETGPDKTKLAKDPAVPPCIQAGIGRNDAALGIERGVYQGEQAYLVVLPHTKDSGQVQAYVVDATCVDTGGSGKAEVLVSHAYPRS
ncbi:zf-HC2 domain-containing protein [Streptomyces purpureus]|uniref:zf-HC2 domain-containing protein n=1 Tax=Streptomyces purpureus TaxID=1951 RepID=UPI00035CB1EA|nr:zf-HC2 domain-containing protein [Streptomyces purpureus]